MMPSLKTEPLTNSQLQLNRLAATVAVVALTLAIVPHPAAAQTTITQWNFDDSTLNPSTGSGTASNIGGTSSGFNTGTPGQGWNTSAYPSQETGNGSAGVQFLFSTLGYQDLSFSFDHRASGTGSRWAQLDYTLNGGTDWVTGFWNNNGGLSPSDAFYSFNVDFGSVTAANDNADFGVRIVSIYSPLAFNQNATLSYGANEAYMRANSQATYVGTSGTGTGNYGGGGTWRFDNVTLTGGLIPAPGAKDVSWNTTTGDWNTSAENWTGGGSTFTNGDNVTFADTAGGMITVAGGGVNPGSVAITASAGTFTFTGGAIGGTGTLTKSGAGTAILAAANSFSGGTTISGGVLQANSDAALGGGGVILDGGTLRSGGAITGSRAITVAAGGGTLDTNGNATTVASVAGPGDFTKDGAGTLTVTGGMPGASGGQVSVAAGTLQLNSTGNIDFNVASSGTGFAGDVILQNAGRIRVTNSGTLGGGGTIFANGNGGTITITGNGLDVNFANDIVIGDEVSIAIGSTSGNTVTYSGVISGGDGGAGIRFTNSYSGGGGAGTTIISGANTYEGDTRFHNTNSGIVQLAGGNDRLPTGTTLVFGATATHGGSTLDLNGVNQTVAGITNDVQPNVGTVTNTGSTKSIFTVSGNATPANAFSGVIAGNLDLVKLRSGTLALTGANTFTGDTDVLGGTLLLDGSIGSTGLVAVGNGATLGGNGSIAGSLTMAAGANFLFDIAKTLTVNGGGVAFGGFSIANLIGLDASTPLGSYTLIDGLANINFDNISDFGPENAVPLGDGKSAFFRSGSLVVEVVPEPSTLVLAGLGLLAAGYAIRRKTVPATKSGPPWLHSHSK